MCGIAGLLGNRRGVDLVALRAALAHRGPDDEGESSPHPQVWLCSARLALRDASPAGAQPMRNGHLTLVYNGELYNIAELTAALGPEARQAGRSDTALILAAYQRWGEDMLERLEGIFALALWDEARQHLLLARDPLGVKPLWLARGAGGRVAFASEIRPLLRSGVVAARLEPAAIETLLATGSPSEPAAILRGIEALPPGHAETLSLDGTARRRCFWSMPEAGSLPGVDAATRVGARLRVAVPQQLAADSQVGLLLSDGIDSAALALLAARSGAGALPSFHVRTDRDTALVAQKRARQLGFSHTEIALDTAAMAEAAHEWLSAQDQPSIDGLNTWIVARAVRASGVKAVLSGLGGDELFVGYPHYRTAERLAPWAATLRRFGGPARALASAQAHVQLGPGRALAGGWRAAKALELLGGALPVDVAMRRLFPQAMRRRLQREGQATPSLTHDRHEASATGAATRDLRGYLVDTLLRDSDAMGMAHGVEIRVPFLDVRLVELVAGLPAAQRLGSAPKQLLLDAVPGLRELAPMAKRGFELPIERLVAGAFGTELRELAADRELVERCGLVPAAVRSLVDHHRGGRPGTFRVLALGSLLGWARRHGASL